MSNSLHSATVSADAPLSVVYFVNIFGSKEPKTRTENWPQAVTDAATKLLEACQAEGAAAGTVTAAQIYSADADPDGAPPHSAPGEVVDVYFGPANCFRAGSSALVPAKVAAARDALKAAIQAVL